MGSRTRSQHAEFNVLQGDRLFVGRPIVDQEEDFLSSVNHDAIDLAQDLAEDPLRHPCLAVVVLMMLGIDCGNTVRPLDLDRIEDTYFYQKCYEMLHGDR